jgi:ABC-type dipeptide/oligopeptide/nickel transport system permease subunit
VTGVARRLWADGGGRAGAAVLAALVALAACAPWLAGDPTAIPRDLSGGVGLPPGPGHWLGTDPVGRDVWARFAFGARTSLAVGVLAAALAATLGVAWGALAAWVGGAGGAVLMRTVDAVLGVPRVLVVVAALAFWPARSVAALALLLGATGWLHVSRLVHGAVARERRAGHVLAARAVGVPEWRIVIGHVLPAATGAATVAAALGVAEAIALEAALSYFDLGVAEPTPTWGRLVHDAADAPLGRWWLVAVPGIGLAAVTLGCNLVSDALRRALDPRAELA